MIILERAIVKKAESEGRMNMTTTLNKIASILAFLIGAISIGAGAKAIQGWEYRSVRSTANPQGDTQLLIGLGKVIWRFNLDIAPHEKWPSTQRELVIANNNNTQFRSMKEYTF
jgi:hypothetical protein